MSTHTPKAQEAKSPARTAESTPQATADYASPLPDNRPAALVQRKLQGAIDNSPRMQRAQTSHDLLQRAAASRAADGLLAAQSVVGAPVQRVVRAGQYEITKNSNLRDEEHGTIASLQPGEQVTVDDTRVEGNEFATNILGLGKKAHSWSLSQTKGSGWVVDEALRRLPEPVREQLRPRVQPGKSRAEEPQRRVQPGGRQPGADEARQTRTAEKSPGKEPVKGGLPVKQEPGKREPVRQAPIKQAPVVKKGGVAPVTVSEPVVAEARSPQEVYQEQVKNWLKGLNPMAVKDIEKVKKYVKDNEITLTGGALQLVNDFLRVHGLNKPATANKFMADVEEQFVGTDIREPLVMFSNIMVAVNKSMDALGYPQIHIRQDESQKSGAVFSFATWEMLVNPLYKDLSVSMVTMLYHEARHSEQWFKMIVRRLKKGEAPDHIAAQMGVPKSIVDFAAAKKSPLSSAEAPAIEAYHQSVYGTGQAHRLATLSGDNFRDSTKKESTDYRNLPEEVDAYDTQERVGEAAHERIKTLAEVIPQFDSWDILGNLFTKLEFLCKISQEPEVLQFITRKKIAQLGKKFETLPPYAQKTLTKYAS